MCKTAESHWTASCDLRVKYKILESGDCGEAALVSFDTPEEAPECREVYSDTPLQTVKVFEAESWDEAMQIYYDHFGFGEYTSMDPKESI